MKKYVALLRGINIGGKTEIKMSELKSAFEMAEYVKDLFESRRIENADKKATLFYSIMFFYYSLYDGAKDKKG